MVTATQTVDLSMLWPETARRQYRREGWRQASDMSDAEWQLIEPFMPKAKVIGRPSEADLRCVVDAILHVASTGCQWRQLPRGFSHSLTSQGYFYQWSRDGALARINHALIVTAWEGWGRGGSPPAGVILRLDPRITQSLCAKRGAPKTTERGGPHGYGAGKTINERKRHIVTDPEHHLLGLQVEATYIQDWEGAVGVIALIRRLCLWLHDLFAEGGYRGYGGYGGDKLRQTLAELTCWTVDTIRRSNTANGLQALPRRWVVEGAFAWLHVPHVRLLARAADIMRLFESGSQRSSICSWLVLHRFKLALIDTAIQWNITSARLEACGSILDPCPIGPKNL